jgi:hypothetical protein
MRLRLGRGAWAKLTGGKILVSRIKEAIIKNPSLFVASRT